MTNRFRLVRYRRYGGVYYRYARAERAKTVGYPERFAQEALWHNSKAVHRAYYGEALGRLRCGYGGMSGR